MQDFLKTCNLQTFVQKNKWKYLVIINIVESFYDDSDDDMLMTAVRIDKNIIPFMKKALSSLENVSNNLFLSVEEKTSLLVLSKYFSEVALNFYAAPDEKTIDKKLEKLSKESNSISKVYEILRAKKNNIMPKTQLELNKKYF